MRWTVAALTLLLPACATTDPQPVAATPAGQCSAGSIQALVGEAFSEALATDAQKRSGARTTRVIRPGQAVTMDFLEDRLNIALNAGDKVESLRCG